MPATGSIRFGAPAAGAAPLLAALRPFARRVWARWAADAAALALTWALSAAGLGLALLRGLAASGVPAVTGSGGGPAGLAGVPVPAAGPLPWLLALVGAAAAMALAWRRRPDLLQVARAADRLGLQDRVASALYAAATGHGWAPALVDDAMRAVAAADPRRIRVLPPARQIQDLALVAVAVAGLLWVPYPAGRGRGDPAVAAARQAVVDLAAQELAPVPVTPLDPAPPDATVDRELANLLSRLEAAEDRDQVLVALAEAQARIQAAVAAEDRAWLAAVQGLAAAWQGLPGLDGAAQALAAGDSDALAQALAQAAALDRVDPAARQQLAGALLDGAAATAAVPELAQALRQAAAAALRGEGAAAGASAGDSAGMGREPFSYLQPLLAQGLRRAGAAGRAQAVADRLGAIAGGLAGPGGGTRVAARSPAGAPGWAAASAGTPGGASGAGSGGVAAGGGTGTGAGTGTAPGAAGTGGTGAGGTGGAGAGGTGGAGPDTVGTGAVAGTGNGSGAGAGSGNGPGGAGGLGAGSGGQGAGRGTGGAVTGSGQPVGETSGPRLAVSGAGGASGEVVPLPRSPLAPGAMPGPWGGGEEATGQAPRTLGRQPLPPPLEDLVRRYFGSAGDWP